MKKLYERFLARQLGKPSGLFGKFYMRRFLNQENRRSNELALKHLLETDLDHVLEIGFGGCWLMGQILSASKKARLVGIDHSPTIVAEAQKMFKNEKRVEFHQGRAEKLPFPAEIFSHVCSVHTVYFWEHPEQVARELYRVLRPGGTLILGLHSKAKLEKQTLTQRHFTLYDPGDVVKLLGSCGFEKSVLHSYDSDAPEDNHVIVAKKA